MCGGFSKNQYPPLIDFVAVPSSLVIIVLGIYDVSWEKEKRKRISR